MSFTELPPELYTRLKTVLEEKGISFTAKRTPCHTVQVEFSRSLTKEEAQWINETIDRIRQEMEETPVYRTEELRTQPISERERED